MADFPLQQSGKPGRCGWAKRANQIIRVEVLQFFTHTSSLLLQPLLRNISKLLILRQPEIKLWSNRHSEFSEVEGRYFASPVHKVPCNARARGVERD